MKNHELKNTQKECNELEECKANFFRVEKEKYRKFYYNNAHYNSLIHYFEEITEESLEQSVVSQLNLFTLIKNYERYHKYMMEDK
jgi:hypothetical protein